MDDLVNSLDFALDNIVVPRTAKIINLGINEIDPRIKQLSYSSLLSLHACPRKFQLYKLRANAQITDTTGEGSITFAFGHAVGLGIQLALGNISYEKILWGLFQHWPIDLEARDDKRNKNFYLAAAAIQKFQTQIQPTLFRDWELVYWNGKPAVELSFIIHLPNGFKYRGFVDAVLRHKITGQVRVLETKTTVQTNINGAEYKNSAQAIGYSIVLDRLFPGISDYEVLYLVYKSKSQEYQPLLYNKSYLSRALWIQELLLDVQVIEMYERNGIYPMHGESCYSWYRECEYLHNCTLSTGLITGPYTDVVEEEIAKDNAKYMVNVPIEELIQVQIDRSKIGEESIL